MSMAEAKQSQQSKGVFKGGEVRDVRGGVE